VVSEAILIFKESESEKADNNVGIFISSNIPLKRCRTNVDCHLHILAPNSSRKRVCSMVSNGLPKFEKFLEKVEVIILSKLILVVLFIFTLSGCSKREPEGCDAVRRSFIEEVVIERFDNLDFRGERVAVNIHSDERYDNLGKVWVVSVDAGGKEYIALISCLGGVELSRKEISR